jgi:phenylacetic acid degradation operon negative regulatory protein
MIAGETFQRLSSTIEARRTMAPNPKQLILNLLLAADKNTLSSREAVGSCKLFGIRENNVRVALVRLSANGLVEAASRGSYRLGPKAAALAEDIAQWRHAEQRVCDWQGSWLVVSAGGLSRSDRVALRARERALAMSGFRLLDSHLYVRPDNLLGSAEQARERLYKLGLDSTAPVFSAQGLDATREQAARKLWNGEALNASYRQTRVKLQTWLQKADLLDLETAARECFLLGNEAIRQLVYDPLLPEPLVDATERRAFTSAVQHYDEVGRGIWKRLLGQISQGHLPTHDLHAPLPDQADTNVSGHLPH